MDNARKIIINIFLQNYSGENLKDETRTDELLERIENLKIKDLKCFIKSDKRMIL